MALLLKIRILTVFVSSNFPSDIAYKRDLYPGASVLSSCVALVVLLWFGVLSPFPLAGGIATCLRKSFTFLKDFLYHELCNMYRVLVSCSLELFKASMPFFMPAFVNCLLTYLVLFLPGRD